MEFRHISVLLKESVEALNIKPTGIYVDATLGGGGHSFEILKHINGGRLVGIDQDEAAIKAASEKLSAFNNAFTSMKNNFSNIKNILAELDIDLIDGAVMDLGVSSHQLDTTDRGFSYLKDAPLDMRMDTASGLSAYEVLNSYSEDRLTDIIGRYGEERWAKRIAQFIVNKRANAPLNSTHDLVSVIEAAIPKAARQEGGHPAKRTFQAIRIEVNGELEILARSVEDFIDSLKVGGRLAVITFHSLEDRIVKNVFNKMAGGCSCPSDFPVCVCNQTPKVKVLTKKPILPSSEELEQNARSKSAKLRICEKL